MAEPSFLTSRVLLKARLRSSFAALTTVTGLAFLWRRLFARRGVRILAYHGVETPPTSPFSVSVENFEQQIAYLKHHCDVIDFATFRRWTRGQYKATRPMVVLTFDDGFVNNLECAAPVLQRYGVPAIFFLIAAKLDGADRRFMTAEDAARLAAAADFFGIGSHSLNHRSVARLGDRESHREVDESKSALEAALGMTVECFCYPYGTFNDFDKRSADMVRQAGYALACTSINGVNFRRTDPFRLRRTKIEWSDDIKTFARLVGGAMDGWYLVDYFLRFLQRPRAFAFGTRIDPGGQRGQVASRGTTGHRPSSEARQ